MERDNRRKTWRESLYHCWCTNWTVPRRMSSCFWDLLSMADVECIEWYVNFQNNSFFVNFNYFWFSIMCAEKYIYNISVNKLDIPARASPHGRRSIFQEEELSSHARITFELKMAVNNAFWTNYEQQWSLWRRNEC